MLSHSQRAVQKVSPGTLLGGLPATTWLSKLDALGDSFTCKIFNNAAKHVIDANAIGSHVVAEYAMLNLAVFAGV